VFASELPASQVERLMREAGKRLADELPVRKRLSGSLRSRVVAASELLNEELGAVTHVDENGGFVIRGVVCPLAALTGKHPDVCLTIESLLKQILGTHVSQCCDRTGRPRCCFEIKAS
jgi:predicted ArsR family transcriptional regulator